MAAVLFFAAFSFVGCGNNGAPKENMKNSVDSLSYMFGLMQGNGIKNYYLQRAGIDSSNIDEFIKGMLEGAKVGDDKDKNAYLLGLQMGQNIANNAVKNLNYNIFGEDSTKTISVDNLFAGLVKGITADSIGLSEEQITKIIEEKDEAIRNDIYGSVKKAGEDFLAANKKKEGVKVTESGLQYKVIKAGNGAKPTDKSTVEVKYVGKFVDGKEFDSSKDSTVEMSVSQNIEGFKEALQLMSVGSVMEVYIPYNLAYGKVSRGPIKPFSTLVFNIELVSIKDAKGK